MKFDDVFLNLYEVFKHSRYIVKLQYFIAYSEFHVVDTVL